MLSTPSLPPLLLGVEILGERALQNVVSALTYSVLGLVLFSLVWFVVLKITPFSVQKEIEEDQNIALGIILGALIIGISMIISAAVQG
jgi:uncharacterized membrane protein YjfL (UPF0719 family)